MDVPFDLRGAVRRIRRIADLSQRELAQAAGMSVSAVAQAESGTRDLPVSALGRAAAVAGLRLALLDAEGTEVTPMADDTVRDRVGRHFPAHLDTEATGDRSGHWAHRYDRPRPWHTYGRDRDLRDASRRRDGTPGDHLRPQPDDDPAVRAAARRAEVTLRNREEWLRRLAAGEVAWPPEFECTCPPECAELDQGLRPVHTDACPCRCDVD